MRLAAGTVVVLVAASLIWQASSFATKPEGIPVLLEHIEEGNRAIDARGIASVTFQAYLARLLGDTAASEALSREVREAYLARLQDPELSRNERLSILEALAKITLQLGDDEAAYRFAADALQEQPQLRDASGVLVTVAARSANALSAEGAPEQAIEVFREVLTSGLAEVWEASVESQIARIHAAQQEYEASIAAYRSLIARHPSLPEWKALAYFQIARLYRAQSQYLESSAAIEQLETHHPYSQWTQLARNLLDN